MFAVMLGKTFVSMYDRYYLHLHRRGGLRFISSHAAEATRRILKVDYPEMDFKLVSVTDNVITAEVDAFGEALKEEVKKETV